MPRVVLDGKLQGVVRKLHRHLGESQMAERNGGAESQSIMKDMDFGLQKIQKIETLWNLCLFFLFLILALNRTVSIWKQILLSCICGETIINQP